MKDYEYYRDEMDKGVVPFIEGQAGVDDKVYLGKVLTWLPRKIINAIKRIFTKE